MKKSFTTAEALNLLIHRVKNSDEKAFSTIYGQYFYKLWAFLRSLNLEENADDIIQETFITLWRKRKELDAKKSFDAYLFTIAKNYALKDLRKKLKSKIDIYDIEITSEDDFDKKIETKELESELLNIIDQLPEQPKKIFILRRFQGFSVNQIADKLKISPKTVQNHMNTALSLIRKKWIYMAIIFFYFM